ncbi:hypothetical protein AURDEDRAFT_181078 [Auricularia subglabra TFB-10046 SS5]|nr:hypothetical protein AURDEDRAFT_181078 [Auricularia subglabra TFB-10046 SS5]
METVAIMAVAFGTVYVYNAAKDFLAAASGVRGTPDSSSENDAALAQDYEQQRALSILSAVVLPLDIMAAIFIIFNAPGFLSLKSFPFVSMTGFTLVAAFMFLTRINLPRDLVGEVARVHLRKLMLDGIIGPCIVVPYALLYHRTALSGKPWTYGSLIALYGLQAVGWYSFFARSLRESAGDLNTLANSVISLSSTITVMNTNPAHDRINLQRLVNRIQIDVERREDWVVTPESQRKTALHARAVARKIAYARQLLSKVEQDELDDPQPSSSRQRLHAALAQTLDRLEDDINEVERRLAILRANAKPPPSFLATLPLPKDPTPPPEPSAEATLIPSDTTATATLVNLTDALPSPQDIDEPLALLPAAPAPAAPAPASLLPANKPTFLSTSLQTQEALGDELARMARQLRANAEHFSGKLAEDKAVLEGTQEKIEGNLGSMVAQRDRLKDYSATGRSTTWLVFISVVVVLIAWVFMLFLIRFTR